MASADSLSPLSRPQGATRSAYIAPYSHDASALVLSTDFDLCDNIGSGRHASSQQTAVMFIEPLARPAVAEHKRGREDYYTRTVILETDGECAVTETDSIHARAAWHPRLDQAGVISISLDRAKHGVLSDFLGSGVSLSRCAGLEAKLGQFGEYHSFFPRHLGESHKCVRAGMASLPRTPFTMPRRAALASRLEPSWRSVEITFADLSPEHPIAADLVPNHLLLGNLPPEHPLRDLPRHNEGLWLTKTQGRFMVRVDDNFDDINAARSRSEVSLLELVNERFPELPDFRPLRLSTRDTPELTTGLTGSPQVILAFSVDRDRTVGEGENTVHAIPDYTFDNWPQSGMSDHDDACRQLRSAGSRPAKKDVAGWVGNVFMNPSRVRILELSKESPGEIEARHFGWFAARPGVVSPDQTLNRSMDLVELVSTYAYLLDVEGSGFSGRLKLLFHTGRPLLLQDRRWQQFFLPELVPFTHYVPVANDFHDLQERVLWLRDNPQEAKNIAANALVFAQDRLTRSAAVNTWADELRTHAAPADR